MPSYRLRKVVDLALRTRGEKRAAIRRPGQPERARGKTDRIDRLSLWSVEKEPGVREDRQRLPIGRQLHILDARAVAVDLLEDHRSA